MRKLFYVTTIIIVLLISFLGITYSYEYNEDESVMFELIGPYEYYLDVNSKYEEYGIKVFRNGLDISSYVNIDSSLVDTNRLGEYKVKYELEVDGINEYIYRIVKVIDNIKPEIKLNGEDIVYVDVNGIYYELGCEVIDNYDENLEKKVIVTSDLNITKVGEYDILYKVSDSSGNENSIRRRVIVRDDKKENS